MNDEVNVKLTNREIGLLRDLLERYYRIEDPDQLEKLYIQIDKKLFDAE